jgi:putative integral membrane protein (TIGR02587 family)
VCQVEHELDLLNPAIRRRRVSVPLHLSVSVFVCAWARHVNDHLYNRSMLKLASPTLQFSRGFGGAVLFSFPMLMTMEMWSLGVSVQPLRLLLFIAIHLVLLIGLATYAREEAALMNRKALFDAFAAYGIGVLASATVLLLFGIVGPEMSVDGLNRVISIQAAPASFGAMVAHLELDEPEARLGPLHSHGLGSSAFLMAVGALYLCSSLASTEEMMLIAHKMSVWQIAALMAFSMLMMLVFDQLALEEGRGNAKARSLWAQSTALTFIGYPIALSISLYILWTFGRTDGLAFAEVIKEMCVLGFPAALGAGAARLLF